MSRYTPTTEQVRDEWASRSGPDMIREFRAAVEFERWLNTVKAEAWERGLIQGRAASIDGVDLDLIDNPYRKGADQ